MTLGGGVSIPRFGTLWVQVPAVAFQLVTWPFVTLPKPWRKLGKVCPFTHCPSAHLKVPRQANFHLSLLWHLPGQATIPAPDPPGAAVAPRPRARSCTFCFCPPFKHVEAPDNRHFLQEAENPTFLLQKAVNWAMHIWEGRQKPEMKCKDMNAFSVAVFLIVSFVLNTSAVIVSSKSVVTLQPVSPNNLKHFPRVFSLHQVSHEPDKARSSGAAQSPSQQFHRSLSHFNLLRLRPRGNKRRAASRLGPIGVPLHGVRLVVGALPRAVYTTFLTFLYSSGPPSFSCSLSWAGATVLL